MTTKRKTFYFNDDEEKPIMAGGVILYKIEKGKIYLLLIDSKGYYQDLGGKFDNIEESKESIIDVISREVNRESNFLLNQDSIKERLLSAKLSYTQQSKYIIYIISANEEESKLTSDIFSKEEINENSSRRIKWVPMEVFMKPNIMKHKVSVRLKNKYFFDILKNIEKDMLEWEIFL